MHYFVMKILSEGELQQIAINHSSYAVFKAIMKLYKKCTEKLYSFLVNDTTLPSDNSFSQTQTFAKNVKSNHDD